MNSARRGKATANRFSPVEARAATLVSQQRRKMAESAHRYVRGSTVKFYEWLGRGRGEFLPQGPPIWICGDCHNGNLGPVASAEGKVEIEIRDLDQTVVGNPVHDLIRLGLSMATAVRGSDLPGVITAHVLEHLVEGYQAALNHPQAAPAGDELAPIARVLRLAVHRRWKHLAQERIDDVQPVIPLGRRFWPLSPEERHAIEELLHAPEPCRMITRLTRRDDDAKLKVMDAAYWMKGCSSLGKLRFAVLLRIGKGERAEHCLLDIKEAVEAAAPVSDTAITRWPKAPDAPADFAQRVVEGARALSPFLGGRMMAATLLRKPVVLRELMPQDLKLEIETLTPTEAVGAARFLAAVVGKAHARQMSAATRKRWSAELDRNRSKSLDAPSWLWQSVVELVAEHEVAYLEHCRRYALA